MSVLAWLFGLGAAAIIFPILFHLIRRTPTGQTEFSSLMFLKASPPTLTKRSRLDNWLLLLMRALVILLLAIAFMRPFFRGNAELAQFDVANRRVAILLDVSASMRRADVWADAKAQVLETLQELEAKDQVALFTFDRDLKTVVDFDESEDATFNQQIAVEAIKEKLESIEPEWSHSDLGVAMVTLANRLDAWQDSSRGDEPGLRPKMQMVVVSDLQAGSATEALQAYQWPPLVKTAFKSVAPLQSDNATVELLSQLADARTPTLRVRVTNQPDSVSESFQVNWKHLNHSANSQNSRPSADPEKSKSQLSFTVAPGESRVLNVPLDDVIGANTFLLNGDQESFDNAFFVAPATPQTLVMWFIGDDDPDDPQTLLFYLARAFSRTPTRSFVVARISTKQLASWDGEFPFPDVDLVSIDGERIREDSIVDIDSVKTLATKQPTMMVLGSPVDPPQVKQLTEWVADGMPLFVVANLDEYFTASAAWLGVDSLLEVQGQSRQRIENDYAILADFDFKDPVFQPFADPSFSDFTEIRFWKHQSVVLESNCEILARFDDRSPAVWRREIGSGDLIAFSSSWRPEDSQFALSPKFIAFVANLMELAAEIPKLEDAVTVGDRLVFAPTDFERMIVKPNGSIDVVEEKQTVYPRTSQPGLYRLTTDAAEKANVKQSQRNDDLLESRQTGRGKQAEAIVFAVNVDRRESNDRPIPIEQLEQLGVETGVQETAASELAQMRELRDKELEDQQKVWKWLIVFAILLLILETYYAGRKSVQLASTPSDDSSPSGSLEVSLE